MKRTVAATAFFLALASCGSDTAAPASSDVIDRATFVDAYVELRWTTVHAPDFRLTPEARAEILARHGVGAQDLLRFAEAHGRDLEFMNAVWLEVEGRLQTLLDEEEASSRSGA